MQASQSCRRPMTAASFRRRERILLSVLIVLLSSTTQTGSAFFFHYQHPSQQQQSGYNVVNSHHHHHQQQQQQQSANQLQSQDLQKPTSLANNNPQQSAELMGPNQDNLPGTYNNQLLSPTNVNGRGSSLMYNVGLTSSAMQQQGPISQQQQQQQQSAPPSSDGSPIFRFQGSLSNGTTVKLVWNLVQNTRVDRFEIKYGAIPDTEVFSVQLNGSARDYTVHQLQPDTMYQFRIQGFHNDLEFRPQLLVVKTKQVNAPSAADVVTREITPLGVKAEAKSNSSIQLSWLEPEKPPAMRNFTRVNIIRYYINPSLISTNNNMPPTSQENGGASTATNYSATAAATTNSPQYHYLNVTNPRESRLIVQRLKPATEYAFAIKTVYYSPDMRLKFIQSGFSMDTIAKTFDLEPSAPRNFTVQEMALSKEELARGQMPKLELSWQPPESPNGQLRGYVILHSHDQNLIDEKWLRISVNDSTINNWYVSNLRPGAFYYFKMRSLNQRGQSGDSETRLYVAPSPPQDKMVNMPIPASNVLMMVAIILVLIVSVLSIIVYQLFCNTRRRKPARKGSLNQQQQKAKQQQSSASLASNTPKLNGFASTNSSSTVTARVGTLARRRQQPTTTDHSGGANGKPDFWISAMDQEVKSNISEKSNSDINMAAMVSLQRDSPQQFITQTQLAQPVLPEYRMSSVQQHHAEQQLMQQLHQQQGHYHAGQFTGGPLAFDQMDNATASALMTLSKRQQQQLQKYQIQFAATGQVPPAPPQVQAPSPHQQPPPPPPLNIEQQQQQQQQHLHQQPLYGTHHQLANTRSLRLHRPTMYDPVSGSFVQSGGPQANDGSQPPNYNSHMHQLFSNGSNNANNNNFITSTSNTLQFHHPHQTSTLLSRRSTNTFRSFQTAGLNNNNATYGQLGSFGSSGPMPPNSMANAIGNGQQQQQPQQLLQSHQAVINQLNNSSYPSSLPLKHVSAVRPQIMSSLEDQIEMELAEKEQQQQQQLAQDQQQQQKAIKQ